MDFHTMLSTSIFMAIILGGSFRNVGMPKTKLCPYYQTEISSKATNCPYCTRRQPSLPLFYWPSVFRFAIIGFVGTFILCLLVG